MTKENEQYAYLTITGDFDPETISERLKLSPTEYWRKGDRNERTHYERKFSRWSIYTRLDKSASLEDHVRDVLNQALPCADEIRQTANDYTGFLQLVGFFYNDYPGFELGAETIADLAKLGVAIDCDFYYLYSYRREDS